MQLVVTPDDSGKRADIVIAHRTGLPRSLIAHAARRGELRVNGSPAKGSHIIDEGDVLDYDIETPPRLLAQPESIDVPIVYEDDDVIVVDKPAGMVTHPAHGATSGTLINALLGHVRDLPGDVLRPGLVHRLDRDTSGLLVVAKTEAALSALGKAMKARHISREYLGLVRGIPAHAFGTIDGPIGRDPRNRLKYTITADGKPAITHYEVREPLEDASEVLFRLETGRTHQIRVHMAALGHPLVNDPVYGRTDPRFQLAGQALHAWRLAFRHPGTGRDMEFQVDPPVEYVAAKRLLRAV